MKHLTPSKEHYLKAIHTLSAKEGSARVSDIAEALSVSKASVCMAMDDLQVRKLIRRDSEHRVVLTNEGRHKAVILTSRFKLIQQFLVKVLHVGQTSATHDACALEHVVSEETLVRMNGLLQDNEKEEKQ